MKINGVKKQWAVKILKVSFALMFSLMTNNVSASSNNKNSSSPLLYKQVLQQDRGEIRGIVRSHDGKFLSNVTLNLAPNISTKSVDDGTFVLANIPAGEYQLSASHNGYESFQQFVNVLSGQKIELSLSLEPKTRNLGEVVVTASRLAESINEVPSSLTYIGPKDLQMQSQINDNLPNMLMQKVPSISPSEESQNNFIGKIRGRSFLVMVDGIPQSTPLRNGGRDLRAIDPSAIDHIEVIHGASSMYGNGAAGGIVNYITKKQQGDRILNSTTYLSNSVSLVDPKETYGYHIAQVFSGKKDKVDYLLQGKIARTGVVRSSDGTINSPFYGLGETKSYNSLLKLGYQLNENHRLELMGNYYRSMQDSKYEGTKGTFGESPSIAVPSQNPANGGTPYNKNASLRYDGKFGKTDANAILYYEDMNTIFETYNQIYSDHGGARLNFTTPFNLGTSNNATLIYGVDLLKDHAVQMGLKHDLVTPDMNMNSFAYYVQSKFNLAEYWIVKAGIRHEFIGFKVGDLLKGDVLTKGDKNSSNALVFNVAARYNKMNYFQPFISFSQGYSIGDVGLVLRNGVALDAIDAKPVLVNNYEAGINGILGGFDYQLTGYFSTSDKGSTFAEVGSPGNYALSQIPQRIYGFEAVANLEPLDGLKIGGVLGYMNGRQDLKNEGTFKDKLDNSILTPLKVSLNLDVKITNKWNAYFQMMNISGRDVFMVEEYNYGKFPVSGYNICDINTSYRLKNVTLNLSVNNLFNTDYYPTHAAVRGATSDGRYYIKGSGTIANVGVEIDL